MAPEQLRALSLKPAALRRKVIEITPNLSIAWAGDYAQALVLGQRIRSWFSSDCITESLLDQFIQKYYPIGVKEFWALIVPNDTNWYYRLGNIYSSRSPFCGDYAVAGSGSQIFKYMANQMVTRPGDEVLPDIDALRLANDLMAREIVTGETWHSAFGASYEILYNDVGGFKRVDDIFHFFALARVGTSNIDIAHYPHAIRQWYEDDQLCIGSFVTPDATRQGLKYELFAVPSIFDEPKSPVRSVESLAERPNYMCVHHLFDISGQQVPSTLIMKGDAINDLFALSLKGSELQFECTPKYVDAVYALAAQIIQQPEIYSSIV